MQEKTPHERAIARRYFIEIGVSSTLYVITTLGSGALARSLEDGDPYRILIALIPVIPAGMMLLSVVRFVVRSDELMQRIHMQGAMAAAIGMMMFSITYGFLESWAGFPPMNPIWVAMLGILIWGFGGMFVQRQYD